MGIRKVEANPDWRTSWCERSSSIALLTSAALAKSLHNYWITELAWSRAGAKIIRMGLWCVASKVKQECFVHSENDCLQSVTERSGKARS